MNADEVGAAFALMRADGIVDPSDFIDAHRPERNGLTLRSHSFQGMRVLPCIWDKMDLSYLSHMHDFPIKTPQQLGSVLRGWRSERGLTQQAVGSEVGLAQKAVSQIETDPGRVGLARIFKILAALDLELVLRPQGKTHGRSEW